MRHLHVEPDIILLAPESVLAHFLVGDLLHLEGLDHLEQDQLGVLAGGAVDVEGTPADLHAVFPLLTREAACLVGVGQSGLGEDAGHLGGGLDGVLLLVVGRVRGQLGSGVRHGLAGGDCLVVTHWLLLGTRCVTGTLIIIISAHLPSCV